MKKLTFTLIAFAALLTAMAQTPEAFNYQTAVRNTEGEPIADQEVAFEITILQGSAAGTAVYTETHAVTTNTYGLVNFQIGAGTSEDDFAAIDWASGSYFVKVAFDAAGGTDYVEMGISQLLSVPFAKYADVTDFASEANTAVTAETATAAETATTADEANHAVHADTANYAAYAALAETTADMDALLDRIAALEEMSGIGAITDIDGNEYPITKIGNQVWMAKNLRTTRYADGTPIPKVEGGSNWEALGDNNTEKAYCWYLDDSTTYAESNGAYYTFAAANNGETSTANPSGVQGACPDGWHVPSESEWQELLDYLAQAGHDGMQAVVLKDTTSWDAGGNGNNLYGFSARAVSYREADFDVFGSMGVTLTLLNSSEASSSNYNMYYIANDQDNVQLVIEAPKSGGYSLRCIKN